MKVGVYGITCEVCPRMIAGKGTGGERGCVPKENRFCGISTFAFDRNRKTYFQCEDFPCITTKSGPISYEYCRCIAGKEEQ